MRRRPPQSIQLKPADRTTLQRLLQDGHTEQRIARRARILLAMSNPNTIVEDLADQVAYTPTGIWYVCRRFETNGLATLYNGTRAGRPRELSALARVQIEQLACCDPRGLGLHLTHWSTRSLTTRARKQLSRPRLAPSTVALILRQADLQPHRSRYWKTPTLNADFAERASRILWCYEQVDRLRARDEIVLTLDEKPNIQAIERAAPTQAVQAGPIERQEFEYIRHDTVNFLVVMAVHSGKMQGHCLERNNSAQLCQLLPSLLKPYRRMRRVHLIWDGAPSHVSAATQSFLRDYRPWLRVLCTPARASWLNQAELLLKCFAGHYLTRGSWNSRQTLIDHLIESGPEYNRLFAQPINWSWTRRNLRKWIAWKVSGLS